jgi:heterodisulfide reductase subunit B2
MSDKETRPDYALFLGCTIPARGRNYEMSARRVAESLGIGFEPQNGFMCCGFPVRSSDSNASELLAAFNLALAEHAEADICVLCSSCGAQLMEVAHRLNEDPEKFERVNNGLRRVGLQYHGGVKIRHFARILLEEAGADNVTSACTRRLEGLKVAVHYGCHYLKPSEIHEGFDDVEDPTTIEKLVSLTGATCVDYDGKKLCCGGPVLPVDESTALAVAGRKLQAVSEAEADVLCLVCPFCSVMYDGNQKSVVAGLGLEKEIPVLYLTQLLGAAMGFDRKELGLNLNVVKTKNVMDRWL